MDIRKLQIFCEVYRQGGFSQAAKKLRLTQSAVSQQIKALESELGVSLFDPDSRATPTASGDYLMKEGELFLAQLDDIRNGVKDAAGVGGGTVRFGMIDVAAISLMPKVLKIFRTKQPNIELDAVVKATGELVNMVDMHQLDFAVAVTNNAEESFECQPVYSDSIVAIVPRKSSLDRGKISVMDLKGEPLILYPPSSHSRGVIEDVFRSRGVVPTVNMEMHYPAAICSLVQQGMGVGLISELSARESKMKGQSIVGIDELTGVRQIGIVTHRKRKLSPQAKALISTIKQVTGD
ncbi:MAG: LysR family transcriptional regulator [Deltaproteobacteria bacterium]|nr:LysR family transcriptional regulator [Deltaproteobacteria bacterium]